MKKTVNDFIEELQSISEDKRELPLVIECPNGLRVPPEVKMGYDDETEALGEKGPDEMVLTWRG